MTDEPEQAPDEPGPSLAQMWYGFFFRDPQRTMTIVVIVLALSVVLIPPLRAWLFYQLALFLSGLVTLLGGLFTQVLGLLVPFVALYAVYRTAFRRRRGGGSGH